MDRAGLKRIAIHPPVAAFALAVVLFLLSGLLPNGFGSNLDIAFPQATNIIRVSVFLAVVAAGQTLVIISGREGIDLSAGAVVTLSAIATYTIVNGQNENVLQGLVLTLITSLLTTMQMPESVRRMVLGGTLLVMISIYGRQRGFRQ